MLSRGLTITLATGLAGGLLLLAGCGSDKPSSSSTATPQSSATPTASASATATASAAPSASSPATVKPATSLSGITVTGGYGKKPTVKLARTPWAIDKTRSTVLSPGKGGTVTADMTVEVNYFGVDARTGKTFDESFSRHQSIAFPLSGVIAGFKKGLVGQKQGSRVLVAMPGSDAYDASGGSAQAGINVGDTLIFVVDIVSIPLTGPSGQQVPAKPGLPKVSSSRTSPTVSVPSGKPPASLVARPLIKGNGKKVTAADAITMHYLWVNWSDGKVVETDYGKPATQQVPVAQLVSGLKKGLIGQTVGSRVLIVVPPAEGYPKGNQSPSVKPTDTLVFVVDILFSSAAQ